MFKRKTTRSITQGSIFNVSNLREFCFNNDDYYTNTYQGSALYTKHCICFRMIMMMRKIAANIC